MAEQPSSEADSPAPRWRHSRTAAAQSGQTEQAGEKELSKDPEQERRQRR